MWCYILHPTYINKLPYLVAYHLYCKWWKLRVVLETRPVHCCVIYLIWKKFHVRWPGVHEYTSIFGCLPVVLQVMKAEGGAGNKTSSLLCNLPYMEKNSVFIGPVYMNILPYLVAYRLYCKWWKLRVGLETRPVHCYVFTLYGKNSVFVGLLSLLQVTEITACVWKQSQVSGVPGDVVLTCEIILRNLLHLEIPCLVACGS